MAEYTLVLTKGDEHGRELNKWNISTEYDFDINDPNSYGKFDFYIVKDEYERLGRCKVGQDVGEEVATEVGCDQDW